MMIITIIVLLILLQIIAIPYLFYIFKRLPLLCDAGWAFGRFVVLLILALLIWFLAFARLPVNTILMVRGFLFLFLFFSIAQILLIKKSLRREYHDFFRQHWSIFLIEEVVFFTTFAFLLWTRSFQPEILGLEKFMDAGFIQAYLKSPTLPARDIWFAHGNINYYSFGHFYASILVKLWGVDLSYAYNFLLASIFGIFSSHLFSLVFNWRANFAKFNYLLSVLGGILAIILAAFGSNGHLIWYFIKNHSTDVYWYPDATRFIERTIHEFPSYSFVVSDLHAHVLSLPLVTLLLLIIWLWTAMLHQMNKKVTLFLAVAMGALFGILAMTNTWDILIYGLLLSVISLLSLWRSKQIFILSFQSAILVAVMTALLGLVWYLNFDPISSGIEVAKEHSPLWQLLVMWGAHLSFASLLITLVWRRRSWLPPKQRFIAHFVLGVSVTSLLLIVFPELFYFTDIYTGYPRANTMFKLVFQVFMWLALLFAFLTSLLPTYLTSVKQQGRLQSFKLFARNLIFIYSPLVFFIYFTSFNYSYLAYRSYYGGWKNHQGLDGLSWLQRKDPADWLIIQYLKEREKKQVNIVEAVGDSYTEFARISAFSGMSTILGWRVHEWLWRAGWDQPAARTEQVRQIYEQPRSQKSQELLEEYQIKYIVVASKERQAYSRLDLEGLLQLGKLAWTDGYNYLIRLF